jgi:hypothetical protein
MTLVCDPNEPPVFIHKPAIPVAKTIMSILEPMKPVIFDSFSSVVVSVLCSRNVG